MMNKKALRTLPPLHELQKDSRLKKLVTLSHFTDDLGYRLQMINCFRSDILHVLLQAALTSFAIDSYLKVLQIRMAVFSVFL